MSNIKIEEDLIYRIIENWGNAVHPLSKMVIWLKEYASIVNERKDNAGVIKATPYQLCPKCNGQGTMSKPPYIPGDVNQWSSSSCQFQCDVCQGQKIIPMSQPQQDNAGSDAIEFADWIDKYNWGRHYPVGDNEPRWHCMGYNEKISPKTPLTTRELYKHFQESQPQQNTDEKLKTLEDKVDKLSALHTVFGPLPVDEEKDTAELEHYFKSRIFNHS